MLHTRTRILSLDSLHPGVLRDITPFILIYTPFLLPQCISKKTSHIHGRSVYGDEHALFRMFRRALLANRMRVVELLLQDKRIVSINIVHNGFTQAVELLLQDESKHIVILR